MRYVKRNGPVRCGRKAGGLKTLPYRKGSRLRGGVGAGFAGYFLADQGALQGD